MAATVTVYNHDVVGLYNRLNRIVVELTKSVSSSVSLLNTFDRKRLQSYIDSAKGYLAWVVAQPQLDLPETSPYGWPLEAAEPIVDVENEEIDDMIRLVVLAREELTNSQSARMGSGLMGFDASRFGAVVDKLQTFLLSYVDTLTPLDLPESSPQDPMSGPGKVGV